MKLTIQAQRLILTCFLAAIIRPMTAQEPVVFDVSNVVVGAQRIPTLYLYAAGKWSDAGDNSGGLSMEIQCYKRLGFCAVAHAFTSGDGANVALDSFDILRWDRTEIIAVDSSAICIVSTIRVDLATKRITLSSSDKGQSTNPFCKGSDKLSTAVLWGSKDIAEDAVKRARTKQR